MRNKKPKILLTNDDGINAPGLKALVEAMADIGDVLVVAPDSPQSGMGHAITIAEPLRLEKVDQFEELTVEAYQCSGTPVDCVKLAKDKVLYKNPDLCISGINHGSNSSINVIYSGTMSAAVEASIEDIDAIGISLLDYRFDADFEPSKKYLQFIARNYLSQKLPKGTLLNVNVPAIPEEEIKGVRICRQANAKWEEEYDQRKDPRGKDYYWLAGKFRNYDKGEDTDEWALKNGYVSIVPVQYDMTAHHSIAYINNHWNVEEKL